MKSFCLTFIFLFTATLSVAGPTVSNVRATQRTDGSGIVDVYYNLSGGASPMTVSVIFSFDDGQNWSVVPQPGSLQGDHGHGINNGTNRHIEWNAGQDRPGVYWTQTRAGDRNQRIRFLLNF